MKQLKLTVETKLHTAKLLNLKVLKAKFYILQKNLEKFMKKWIMKNVKFHTKGQFCMYMKQFSNKLAKKFDKSMKNKSR
ncbi:hypothetical protein EHI52_04050 [Mesomycoplasma hyopneumoniae]|uniref:hypothetical protein n=1 Tax=Mesomycoplasma hyopneumoniae TaxID=2099 RepID=UPI0011BBDBCA|nr:hypothetical protein [Mesomycoplasma hyopneumoniae]QEA02583.1 hypothetical protein EHI52_04050 [Mesomycoplasma hyopneumoniae]